MTEETGIFLATAPGLEAVLAKEARAKGFDVLRCLPGGVEARGGLIEAQRANLELRGAARVLWRIGAFRAFHLAQLDKRARRFPWGDYLRADVPVRVEARCRASKIYHAGAAAERIGRAIAEELGAPVEKDAEVVLKARIDDNMVTLSLDTSGAPLHRRGLKRAVGKAPMRENLAALFLMSCGYRGTVPVVDPMCGSGTFVIEAAEMAAGLRPGRARDFAFAQLAGADMEALNALRRPGRAPAVRFFGADRDQGAIAGARDNAGRAGVAQWCEFACQPVSDLAPPPGPKGLVIANPPYGGRIGNRKLLFALYGRFGQVLRERFAGWKLGVITSDGGLANAMDLPLAAGPVVDHGGQKVRLYQADVG